MVLPTYIVVIRFVISLIKVIFVANARIPLEEKWIEVLRQQCTQRAAYLVAQDAGISASTITRALAGLPLQPGNRLLLAQYLAHFIVS